MNIIKQKIELIKELTKEKELDLNILEIKLIPSNKYSKEYQIVATNSDSEYNTLNYKEYLDGESIAISMNSNKRKVSKEFFIDYKEEYRLLIANDSDVLNIYKNQKLIEECISIDDFSSNGEFPLIKIKECIASYPIENDLKLNRVEDLEKIVNQKNEKTITKNNDKY